MPPKVVAKKAKSSGTPKESATKAQETMTLKRKAGQVLEESPRPAKRQAGPSNKSSRSSKSQTASSKQKATSSEALSVSETLHDAPGSSIHDKLTTLSANVRHIHKVIDGNLKWNRAGYDKITEMKDVLDQTNSTVEDHHNGDQQADILEKLEEIESQIAGVETCVMDELSALAKLIVQKVDGRFWDLNSMLRERLDDMDETLSDLKYKNVSAVVNYYQGR